MKTIKRERQVRLDELLKCVWDNSIKNEYFNIIDGSGYIEIDSDGDFKMVRCDFIRKRNLFTITEEVEIDYDTRLDLIAVRKAGTVSRFENRSIQGVLVHFEGEVDYIYFQNPDGSIGELIWDKERGLVD